MASQKEGLFYFLFDGQYTDLSDEWFENVSYFLISPLFLEILMPVFEWFVTKFLIIYI